MADIDLNLYIRNEQFIKALKEAGVEWDKYSADRKLNDAEQIASQDKLIAKIDQLKKKQAELWAQYKKSGWSDKPKGLVETTRAIEDNEKALGDLTDAQKDAEKQTDKTTQATTKGDKATKSYGSSARTASLIIIAMVAAGKLLTAILDAGKTSSDRLARGWSALKFAGEELLKTINSGDWANFFKKMKDAADVGRQFAMSQEINAAKTLSTTKAIDEINVSISYYKKLIDDVTTSETDRIKYQKIIYELEKERAANSTALAESQLNSSLAVLKISKDELEQMLALAPAYEENAAKLQAFNKEREKFPLAVAPADIKDLVPGYAKYAKVQGDAFNAAAAALSNYQQTIIGGNALIDQSAQDAAEKDKKAKEDALKRQEEFNKAIDKLFNDYEKSNIDSLSGVEQINAVRDFTIQNINEEQARLEKLGTLNEEHYRWLNALRDAANNKAEKDIAAFHKKELEKERKASEKLLDEISKAYDDQQALWDLEKELEIQAIELSGKDKEAAMLEVEKRYLQRRITAITARIEKETDVQKKLELQKLKELLQGEVAAVDKQVETSGFNFWDAIGVTDEDEQDRIKENIKVAVDQVTGMLDEMFAKRVEDAQRNRELLDTQIDDTQAALDAEVELAKLGYANNVDAKKKELAELEKQRKAAIKKEEEALKAQQKIESAYQAMSMVSAIAGIFKGSAEFGPVGWIVAIAATAAMLAAFAAAKIQAVKATKLAEGAVGTETGIISGKRHSEGGEHFLNHVEVEKGEMWGVLNRSASQKYGKQFNQVVTSFNKDKMPVMQPAGVENNILVDVNQTNERLDKMQVELQKLNKHFGKTKEVSETSNVRIERTGNKTRIIRK